MKCIGVGGNMKIKIITEVDAAEKNTEGKHAYVVALCCGGLMEDPEIHYEDYQIIRANTPEEAKQKYDKINNCSSFYGQVIEQVE